MEVSCFGTKSNDFSTRERFRFIRGGRAGIQTLGGLIHLRRGVLTFLPLKYSDAIAVLTIIDMAHAGTYQNVHLLHTGVQFEMVL